MSSGQTMGNQKKHYEQKWSQNSYVRTIKGVSNRLDERAPDEKEQIQQTFYNLSNKTLPIITITTGSNLRWDIKISV